MPLTVRFCETDMMGIVHHSNYLVYFEAGRVDWLRRRGISYEQWVAMDVHLPVIDAQLRYRKAAKFDESLVVETMCAELSVVTVRFTYRVLRGDDLLCDGSTQLACVGQNMRPKRFPKDVLETFVRAEHSDLTPRPPPPHPSPRRT